MRHVCIFIMAMILLINTGIYAGNINIDTDDNEGETLFQNIANNLQENSRISRNGQNKEIAEKPNGPNSTETTTWAALSSGVNNNAIYAVAASGSNIYVGGDFVTAGGSSAYRIAKWNGSSWSALTQGLNNTVYAIAVSGSDVYVGGAFTTAGGATRNYIAKWNGSSWSSLGGGMNGSVYGIAVNGSDVFAGGNFTTAGGKTVNFIARWDGSEWWPLGSGANNTVYTVAGDGSNIYIGGSFTYVNGINAYRIAKWNGTSWSVLFSGTGGTVRSILIDGSDLYAGGEFTTAGGSSANYIARWNGSSWSALGSGMNSYVYSIDSYGSNIYAGGGFTTAGGTTVNRVARWNGSAWSAIGSGTNNLVRSLVIAPETGKMYVGGNFTLVDGSTPASHIASVEDTDNPFPIELISFTAEPAGSGSAILRWRTETELDNYGFWIERSFDGHNFKPVGFVEGFGNSDSPKDYQYNDIIDDKSDITDLVYYRLKPIDTDGSFAYSDIISINISDLFSDDFRFEIVQNYPNPFNPETKVRFFIPEAGEVNLVVYSIKGEKVATLANGSFDGGSYEFSFNGKNLASGIYISSLSFNGKIKTKKMMLLK